MAQRYPGLNTGFRALDGGGPTRAGFSRVHPAASQRSVQIDLRQQQVILHLDHAKLGGEQRSLGIKHIQIRRVAVTVAILRNAQCFLRYRHLSLQLGQLFAIAANGVKAVIDLFERAAQLFLMALQRLIALGHGDIHLGV